MSYTDFAPKAINLPKERAPAPLGTYSHAVQAGPFVFLCGMGCRDPQTGTECGVTLDGDGKVVAYDIEAQTRGVIANMEAVLKEMGYSLKNVVDVTVFLCDMNDFEKYNRIYGEFFNFDPQPTRTTVQVAKLPGKNFIEIKAIAVCQ